MNYELYSLRAHSFGQFKMHALRDHAFPTAGLVRTFKSAGSADLSSFGGVGVGWAPDLLC
jgi:hypothetical protein